MVDEAISNVFLTANYYKTNLLSETTVYQVQLAFICLNQQYQQYNKVQSMLKVKECKHKKLFWFPIYVNFEYTWHVALHEFHRKVNHQPHSKITYST